VNVKDPDIATYREPTSRPSGLHIRSVVLTSISSSRRSREFGVVQSFGPPAVAARLAHLFPSQPHHSLHPTMFSGSDSLF